MAVTKVQLVSNIVGNVSGGASFTGIVTASSFVGGAATFTNLTVNGTQTIINTTTSWVAANLSNTETSNSTLDILSNGFKWRDSGAGVNGNGNTYIYAAFAETPSFNLYGGQANAR